MTMRSGPAPGIWGCRASTLAVRSAQTNPVFCGRGRWPWPDALLEYLLGQGVLATGLIGCVSSRTWMWMPGIDRAVACVRQFFFLRA